MLENTASVENFETIAHNHKYSDRCKLCFNTFLDIKASIYKELQATICHECCKAQMNNPEWYHRVRAKMDAFNNLKINISKDFSEYEKILKKIEFENPFFIDMYEFIHDTFESVKKPGCRTPITTEERLATTKFRLTKKLTKDEGTFPNLFGRMNFAFKIISNQNRKNLIYIDDHGIERDLERIKPDIFEGWHNEIIAISGPHLCTYDQKVLVALLKIHHESQAEGAFLKTSLRSICDVMLSSAGGNNLNAIKSALRRLSLARLNVSVLKGITFTDGFFSGGYDSFEEVVFVRWSEFLLAHYRRHQYAILSLSAIFNLSDHAQLMYTFLVTHNDNYKFISIETWKKQLGREHIEKKYFKRALKNALIELIQKKLLEDKSNIDEKEIVHTYLIRNKVSLMDKLGATKI